MEMGLWGGAGESRKPYKLFLISHHRPVILSGARSAESKDPNGAGCASGVGSFLTRVSGVLW